MKQYGLPTKLKELRKSLGLSQQEMATLLGLQRGQISMEESRKRSIPPSADLRVDAIGKILGENPEIPEFPLSEKEKADRLKVIEDLLEDQKHIRTNVNHKLKQEEKKRTKRNRLRFLLANRERLSNPDFPIWNDENNLNDLSSYKRLDEHDPKWKPYFLLKLEWEKVNLWVDKLEEEVKRLKNPS